MQQDDVSIVLLPGFDVVAWRLKRKCSKLAFNFFSNRSYGR